MNVQTFIAQAVTVLTEELRKIEAGEITLGVSNQHFDLSIQSALDFLNSGASYGTAFNALTVYENQKKGDWFQEWSAGGYTNFFSQYDAPELSSGWTD